MRSLIAVSLIAFLCLIPSGGLAVSPASYSMQQGIAIPVEEYWERVRETRQAILDMEGQPEVEVRQRLDVMATRWDQITAVELQDGSLMALDSVALTAELRADPPELKRLESLFGALLQAHENYPQKVFTSDDSAPLQEILRRPEFQWRESQSLQIPDWLGSFLDRLDRFVSRLRNATLPYGRLPLIVAAVLVFLLSLFFISRGLSRNLVREAELTDEAGESEGMLSSKSALKRAETLSMQGDYRNAIRFLYLSSLLVLDEQGLLRYDRSRTNREYLRSISSRPELAKPLRDVIDVFDRVWYGFEAVDEDTYKTYVEHVQELRERKE
jgi:hypothetical protein